MHINTYYGLGWKEAILNRQGLCTEKTWARLTTFQEERADQAKFMGCIVKNYYTDDIFKVCSICYKGIQF